MVKGVSQSVGIMDMSFLYLIEPFQSLGRKLVVLAVCLEVFHQFGEDRLKLLQGGGHSGCCTWAFVDGIW